MSGRHRKGVPPTLTEWVLIQPSYQDDRSIVSGEIPRYIFEAVTRKPFVAGKGHFLTVAQSQAIRASSSYREVGLPLRLVRERAPRSVQSAVDLVGVENRKPE